MPDDYVSVSKIAEVAQNPDLISAEMDFMNAFWILWNLIGKNNMRTLQEESGIDVREFTVLSFLQTRSWTPAHLANEMAIPRYEMSRVLSSLEEKNAIIRTPTPTDRRSVQISTSEEGRRLWSEGVGHIHQSFRPYVTDLEDDLAEMTRLMRKLIARF